MQDKHKWIDESINRHKALSPIVVEILKNIINKKQIEFLSIDYRVKSKDSILEKIDRKNYSNYDEKITDISGIRIIAYLEDDIEEISKIIEEIFEISKDNSSNKDDILSIDKIGYRSRHYVGKLGEKRKKIPEYEDIFDLYFEIQVRTVLQHAWAELSHDRNYKFSSRLPKEIERKLNLHAGLLELADKGFNEISKSIDNYIISTINPIEEKYKSIKIDTISLVNFINSWASKNDIELIKISDYNINTLNEVVDELIDYGVQNLQELENIIPKDFAEKLNKHNIKNNYYSFPRVIMLINNWEKLRQNENISWSFDYKSYDREKFFLEYFTQHELDKINSAFRGNKIKRSKN